MSALYGFLSGEPVDRPGSTWHRVRWPGSKENWVLRDNATGHPLACIGTMEFSSAAWSYTVLVGRTRACGAVVNDSRLPVMEEAEAALVTAGYTLAQPVARPKA